MSMVVCVCNLFKVHYNPIAQYYLISYSVYCLLKEKAKTLQKLILPKALNPQRMVSCKSDSFKLTNVLSEQGPGRSRNETCDTLFDFSISLIVSKNCITHKIIAFSL